MVEAMDRRLARGAAVRVDRQPAVGPARLTGFDEWAALANPAKAVLLEAHDDRRREMVEDHRDVDVGPSDAGQPEQLSADEDGARLAVVEPSPEREVIRETVVPRVLALGGRQH